VETWGIAEAEGNFLRDTGFSPQDMKDLKDSFDQNMERVYDEIIERGAFAWQMLDAGPFVVPGYFNNGTLDPRGHVQPEVCAQRLRDYCKPNTTAAGRALAYTANPSPDNATVQAEQYAAVFLLTRGDYAWIGYDYRGVKSKPYPRPAEWDRDYGAPIGNCAERGGNTMVFTREWTQAVVEWDCNAGHGNIHMKTAAFPVVPIVM